MRKQLFSRNILRYLAILSIVTGSLTAEDRTESNIPTSENAIEDGTKRDIIGATQLSVKEKQKRRDQLAKEDEDGAKIDSEQNCGECDKKASKDGKEKKPWVYAGIVHNATKKAWDSSWIEIEDGSQWYIRSSDRYIIQTWYSTDVIYLTQASWLSSYKYKLWNSTLNTEVEVDQLSCAILGGPYTLYVTSIDYSYGIITLNDGTIWVILTGDSSYLNRWLPGDTVTVGINTGWHTTESPYILINGKVNEFIRGNLY